MRSKKFVWMLGILIALSGCGSDGSTPSPTGNMGNGNMGGGTVDMEALEAAKTAAMMAYDAAKREVANVEADRSADMASYNKAVEQRDAAKEANDKAQAAETVEDAENYRQMAEEANTAAMMYAGIVRGAAASAAALDLAEELAPVIARPDPNPVAGGSRFDGDIDRMSPNVPTTPGDFTTRPLTVDGSKVTHSDDKKFTMSENAPAELTGFAGSIHTREDRAAPTSTRPMVTDEVTVYTDKEDSTPTPFSGEGGVHSLDSGGTDGSTTDPHTALVISVTRTETVQGKNGTTIGDLVNITQHRPTAGANVVTFGRSEADNHDNKRLSGTFDMAPGTYECATTCTMTFDKDGKLTADSTGVITFKPASDAMVPAPDTDYLTFGYWVKTSTPAKGDATTTIAPFATGELQYDLAGALTDYESAVTANTEIPDNSTISATYTGSATGQFVHKTDLDGDGKGPVPTSSGQFTADASLTANFTKGDDPNLGTSFQDAIDGKISNFRDSSTGQDIEGWVLTLNPAKFVGATSSGGFDFSARTSGGKDTPEGGWRGSFYGPATGPDGDDAGEEPDPIQPGSVAGEFLGHFANGHAVGAFGATKDKE